MIVLVLTVVISAKDVLDNYGASLCSIEYFVFIATGSPTIIRI